VQISMDFNTVNVNQPCVAFPAIDMYLWELNHHIRLGDRLSKKPRVAIIILNWNGWKDTLECLDSVFQLAYPSYDVVVVDNFSTDDSLSRIREYFIGEMLVSSSPASLRKPNEPVGIEEYSRTEAITAAQQKDKDVDTSSSRVLYLISNESNLGYGAGNNVGIVFSLNVLRCDYFLVLNNDTVVESELLDRLVSVSESSSDIGIVGPKILYYGRGENIINSAGGRMDLWRAKSIVAGMGQIDKGKYDGITDVDYVMGACLLCRRELAQTIGLLPEDYFLYWEENTYCQRARKAGYRSVYVGISKIWHKSCVSIKKVDNLRHYYFVRNRFKFMQEFATSNQYAFYLAYFLLFRFWIEGLQILATTEERDISLRLYVAGAIEGLGLKCRKC